MDDSSWFDGSDYSFDDSSDSDIGGIWGDSGLSGSDTSGTDSFSASSTGSGLADNPLSDLGSTSAGTGVAGFNWGSLIGPGLGALQGYASAAEKEKLSKEDWDQKFKYEQKLMALQEQYYQAHGQQLEGAMGNFKQYAPASGGNGQVFSGLGQMRPGNAGVPPQTQAMSGGGLLSYGY